MAPSALARCPQGWSGCVLQHPAPSLLTPGPPAPQEDADPMGSQTRAPHTQVPPNPLCHPQSQRGLSSRGTKTPYRAVSKKNPLGSLWLMAAFRFFKDKPSYSSSLPSSFPPCSIFASTGSSIFLEYVELK